MRRSRGQNLIEYVLLVAAVLLVGIAFITNGPMKQGINSALNSMVNEINSVNSLIKFQ